MFEFTYGTLVQNGQRSFVSIIEFKIFFEFRFYSWVLESAYVVTDVTKKAKKY